MSVPVFYSSQMVANSGSYSPSASKPEQVIQSWQLLGIPMQVTAPRPVTRDQLVRAGSTFTSITCISYGNASTLIFFSLRLAGDLLIHVLAKRLYFLLYQNQPLLPS